MKVGKYRVIYEIDEHDINLRKRVMFTFLTIDSKEKDVSEVAEAASGAT